MATVIDSLVVLLGLDASNYKKGRQEAEKETSETARKTQQSADAITKSLTEVGKTVATLFLGFESVSGFGKFLGNLNVSEAQLGRTAVALGLNVHELNRYGLALELAGQNRADAAAAFQTLTAGTVKFLSGQGTSPILDLLRTAGVSAVDAAGKVRNQGQVFEELAQKTARWGAQIQAQRFRDAGIAEGEVQFLIQAQGVREDQLRLAEANNNVNDESVRQAQELQKYWNNVTQHIEAAGRMILTAITPAMEQLLKIFGEVNTEGEEFTTGLKLVGSAAIVIKNLFAGIGDTLGGAVAAIGAALHGDFKSALNILKDQSERSEARNGKEAADLNDLWEQKQTNAGRAVVQRSGTSGYVPPPGSKAARFNNPGNILDRQGNERRYATPEEGASALENDLRIKMERGLKTVDAIINAYEGGDTVHNDIPAYIADVRKRMGKNELTPEDIKQLALAISTHESGPSAARAAPIGGGNSTTVSIGTMNVASPNADPRAVADHVPAAIQRKLDVAQAAQGQS